ncbi:uncharacterized protein DS421_17g571090 [Arachis hypogaea]|nr:uncharacterized protein DS421_17g571090 [Arachis hypogaea]
MACIMFVNMMKPTTCFWRKKKKERHLLQQHHHQQLLTLEEWLLRTPIMENDDDDDNGEYTPTTLEKLLKDEKGSEVMGFGNSMSRSKSCKQKKRVSFRLPEVADTLILYD